MSQQVGVMLAKSLSLKLGVTPQYIRRATKNAASQGLQHITCRGMKFGFAAMAGAGSRDWAYTYTPIEAPKVAPKPRRRTPSSVALNPADLPAIADLEHPTADEKLAIITFCNTSGLAYGHIAQGLIHKCEAFDLNVCSLEARLRRWCKAFGANGAKALEDRRGGKKSKVDGRRLKRVLYAGGNRHYLTLYHHYCYLYAKDNDLAVNLRSPASDIHYSTFVRAAERMKREDPHLGQFLALGMDAFTYAEPSIGRDWEYPNQRWEIDATKQDIMVKVPLLGKESKNSGWRDYCRREPTADYQLVRMQIIGVVDNCTGATVYGLYSSSNYYGNARLLYKALQKLGKPECIKGDNGKDFVSLDFQYLLSDLGIIFSKAGAGRGDQKGKIERSFRTLQHSPEFETLPGFIGHSVDQRQHLENEASTKLEKLSGVATNIKGDVMWWWEFEEWLDAYMQHQQAQRYELHSPLAHKESQYIYSLLGKRHACKVSKCGLRHNNQYYFSAELWQHVSVGEKVTVIENINDSKRLFVYKDCHLLCEVLEKGEYRKGASLEEAKQIKKAYRQRVVQRDRALAKQAQKEYGEYQGLMRDEYVKTHAQVYKIADARKKAKDNNGFNPLAELRRYAGVK